MRHLPRGRNGQRDLPVLCPRLPRRVHQPLAAASSTLPTVRGGSGTARGGQPRRALAKRRVPVTRGAPHRQHTPAATQPTCQTTCQSMCHRARPGYSRRRTTSHNPAGTRHVMCQPTPPCPAPCAAQSRRLHLPAHAPPRSLSRRGASISSPCSTCAACSSGATAAARTAKWCPSGLMLSPSLSLSLSLGLSLSLSLSQKA